MKAVFLNVTNPLKAFAKNLAIAGFAILSLCTAAHAADVFAPPAAKTNKDQEDRIARLEAALEKAMAKMEAPSEQRASDSQLKLSDPIPLPLPRGGQKGAPAGKDMTTLAEAAIASAELEERILGVMNDSEIYVSGGMVRKRTIGGSVALPPASAVVQSAKQ